MKKYRLYILSSVSALLGIFGLSQGFSSAKINAKILPEFVTVKIQSGETLAVGRYEITVEQWHECVSAKACEPSVILTSANKNHPMTKVSWVDVQNYISWLKIESGKDLRLPTYLEWMEVSGNHKPVKKEKLFKDARLSWAARYDLSAEPQTKVTRTVGGFGSNTFGLSDIKGNVWEWTETQCGTSESISLENCRSGRIAMGEHIAALSDLVRDPGNASCGAGLPPANLGFRLVY